jgi:hypothetical protein
MHSSLKGDVPAKFGKKRMLPFANFANFNWQSLCRGLFQLPIPA